MLIRIVLLLLVVFKSKLSFFFRIVTFFLHISLSFSVVQMKCDIRDFGRQEGKFRDLIVETD